MTQISVLIAEDHTLVRQGLCLLLEAEEGIKVIAQAKTGREAIEIATKLLPNVIVMDIDMPILNGLEATRQILKLLPKTKVLILSGHSNHSNINQVFMMGASGYILKNASSEILANAIREVYKGNTYFSPNIIKIHRVSLTNKKALTMTSREVEVIQLVAEGKANKQIASELGISIKTVEKHRQHLMEKLNIHDTAGLTRYAVSEGIIHLDMAGE